MLNGVISSDMLLRSQLTLTRTKNTHGRRIFGMQHTVASVVLHIRMSAIKEFRSRFLGDISTEKVTNFIPNVRVCEKLRRNFQAHIFPLEFEDTLLIVPVPRLLHLQFLIFPPTFNS